MFHPLSQRLKSWIRVFCSSLIAHGPILATEEIDEKHIGIFFWTSLDTNKVGPEKEIPVIIQTGDKKYYVSETTTGKRKGKDYVTVSESLASSQYKEILKKERNFPR